MVLNEYIASLCPKMYHINVFTKPCFLIDRDSLTEGNDRLLIKQTIVIFGIVRSFEVTYVILRTVEWLVIQFHLSLSHNTETASHVCYGA